jgi:organic radical activating enzyme
MTGDSILKIGFGYTRLCNFRCEFCYSKSVRGSWTKDDAVTVVADAVQHYGAENVEVNWGTGENILLPEFVEVLREVHKLGVPQDLTTNGSVILRKETLEYLDELDVSIDYADPELHNRVRGHPKAFELATQAVKHAARELGMQVTVVMVGTKGTLTYENAYNMAELARSLGAAALRLNLYFFTRPDQFVPSPAQIADFLKGLRDAGAGLYGTSDPVVAKFLGVEPVGYLGSVRLLPERRISPSTYLTSDEWTVPAQLPDFYHNFLQTDVYKRFEEIYKRVFPRQSADRVAVLGYDPYHVEGEVETVKLKQASGRSFIHLGYLPTTIFSI